MPSRHELLNKARTSRALARRAREMAQFLSQGADVERVRAYAAELDALAAEIDRITAFQSETADT
jgi:hypothetical protein